MKKVKRKIKKINDAYHYIFDAQDEIRKLLQEGNQGEALKTVTISFAVDFLLPKVREILIRDKRIDSCGFLFKITERGIMRKCVDLCPLQLNAQEKKEYLHNMATSEGAHALIHCTDSWYLDVPVPGIKPSESPDRKEAIHIRLSFPTGVGFIWQHHYQRQQDGSIILDRLVDLYPYGISNEVMERFAKEHAIPEGNA